MSTAAELEKTAVEAAKGFLEREGLMEPEGIVDKVKARVKEFWERPIVSDNPKVEKGAKGR